MCESRSLPGWIAHSMHWSIGDHASLTHKTVAATIRAAQSSLWSRGQRDFHLLRSAPLIQKNVWQFLVLLFLCVLTQRLQQSIHVRAYLCLLVLRPAPVQVASTIFIYHDSPYRHETSPPFQEALSFIKIDIMNDHSASVPSPSTAW